jgi:hypothetical protein
VLRTVFANYILLIIPLVTVSDFVTHQNFQDIGLPRRSPISSKRLNYRINNPRLLHILGSLKSSVERFMASNLLQRLQCILHFLRIAPSPPSPRFHDCISHIKHLVRTQDGTSDAVASALKELMSLYPLPPVQVIPKGVWPNEPNCNVSVKTHLKSTFSDAANLLKATGRVLSAADEKYLELLLTHVCGWSATYPDHMDDPWVKFFHVRYPQVKGLVPILDSMTYHEELIYFPDNYNFKEPRFFLLATSDRYFIWDASDWSEDELFDTGNTLEDVYNGLKDWRWARSYGNMWDVVEDGEEYLDSAYYFVTYKRNENGNFGIYGSTEEYPGKRRKGLLENIFRGLKY